VKYDLLREYLRNSSKKLKGKFLKNILFFTLLTASIFICIASVKMKGRLPMLRLNMKTQPKTFDPRKAGDVFSSQMIFLLFEGLVKRGPDGSIKLAQAKSYKVSEDKLTYTFTLKDTVWSNDAPVTAYDFEQTWKDILKPDFPTVCDYAFSPIKNAESAKKGLVPLDQIGVKALDAKTLVITLEHPTPYFLELLCLPPFSPVNIANDRKNPKWVYNEGAHFLCNGPFLLEKMDQGNQILLTRNTKYRKTEDLHPEKMVFNIVENNQATLEMFKQGSIDIIGDSLTDIPLEEIPSLEEKWTLFSAPRPCSVFIYINTEQFPFNHPKIRRAFNLALNRQELIGFLGKGIKRNIQTHRINVAYQGGLSAANIVPPCLKENRYRCFFKDNDVKQAKILLEEGMAELGITKEAFKAVVLYYYSRIYGASGLAQIIQQQWSKALGISIKLEKLDFSIALDKMAKGNYSMCMASWTAMYYDPMNVLERFKYKNYAMNFSKWENSRYIELLDRSNHEQGDKRLLTLEEAEKILIEEMPIIPLLHEDYVYMINPHLSFNIPLWGDRMFLPLIQKENKNGCKKH
jgi:oligopeptide transport system substrate-binding protein